MPSKESKILIVLVIILAGSILYRFLTTEEPRRVKDLTYKPGVGAGLKPAPAEGEGPEVRGEKIGKTEPMKTDKKPYRGVITNPFGPLFPPPPPPPPVVAPKLPPVPAPSPFPVITAKGPSPAQVDSGKFKFLGFLQKEGEKKIFIAKEKEIYIVKKGDNIGMFQVGDISDNSVMLIAKDASEEFKLVIEDMKPTKPGYMPGAGRR